MGVVEAAAEGEDHHLNLPTEGAQGVVQGILPWEGAEAEEAAHKRVRAPILERVHTRVHQTPNAPRAAATARAAGRQAQAAASRVLAAASSPTP